MTRDSARTGTDRVLVTGATGDVGSHVVTALADRVADDVSRVLSRDPRTLREYVADYADEFRK